MKQKKCKGLCGKTKNLSEFYKHSQMADGHLNICISCSKDRSIEYRKNNIDKVKSYEKIRSRTEKRLKLNRDRNKVKNMTKKQIESKKLSQKKWRENNKVKRACHIIVGNAVRDGKLIKPLKCDGCGKVKKLNGHHDDYMKPLEVSWLCDDCHGKKHRKD